jgi:hypothetical protein
MYNVHRDLESIFIEISSREREGERKRERERERLIERYIWMDRDRNRDF